MTRGDPLRTFAHFERAFTREGYAQVVLEIAETGTGEQIMPKRHSRSVTSFAAAACLVLAASPALARTVLPVAGSNGDAGAVAECPSGQSLVGFSGRIGVWIDAIQMVCAAPGAQPVALGPRYGGSGGGAVDSFCPRGSQLSAATLNMTTRNRQVAAINYSCRSIQTGKSADYAFGNPSYRARCPGIGVGDCGVDTNAFQSCTSNEVPIGFTVRYGKDVNGFGLICGRITGMR